MMTHLKSLADIPRWLQELSLQGFAVPASLTSPHGLQPLAKSIAAALQLSAHTLLDYSAQMQASTRQKPVVLGEGATPQHIPAFNKLTLTVPPEMLLLLSHAVMGFFASELQPHMNGISNIKVSNATGASASSSRGSGSSCGSTGDSDSSSSSSGSDTTYYSSCGSKDAVASGSSVAATQPRSIWSTAEGVLLCRADHITANLQSAEQACHGYYALGLLERHWGRLGLPWELLREARNLMLTWAADTQHKDSNHKHWVQQRQRQQRQRQGRQWGCAAAHCC